MHSTRNCQRVAVPHRDRGPDRRSNRLEAVHEVIDALKFGDSHAGLLVDGVDDTPYVSATLRMLDSTGVEVEIPFLEEATGQFKHVQEWFSARNPPTNLLMYTPDGAITLFENRWRGHSNNWGGARTSSGRIRPEETVVGMVDQALDKPLRVTRMWSVLDGMNKWTRASSIAQDSETDDEDRVQAVNVRVSTAQVTEWVQGDATMRIRGNWRIATESDSAFRKSIIDDQIVLESEFGEPRSFFDHLQEQRKVANLLVFLYDRQVSFRKHKVAGGGVPEDGRQLLSSRTVREHATPVASSKDFNDALALAGDIGPDGLRQWSDCYQDYQRFTLPSVSALGRTGGFLEDTVISTSMSIEAAGALLGRQGGEESTYYRGRPSTATNGYRCLKVLNIGWGARVHSLTGLARAMANTYNTVKHFDRGDFPDHAELYIISQVNRLVVRLLALRLTGKGSSIVAEYTNPSYRNKVIELMEINNLTIVDGRGNWSSDS